MRFIVVIIAIFPLVFAQTDKPLEDRFLEALNKTLECYRSIIKEGIPELDIPSLDPLEVGDIEFDLDEEVIRGNFKFFDLKIAGLSTLEIQDIGFGIIPPKLTFDLTINFTVTGDYEVDASIINIVPLTGKGDLDLKLGLNLFGKMILSSKGIEELYIFAASDSNFKITGLLEDEYMSDLISRQIASIVDEYINKNKEEISKEVSPVVKDILNLLIMIIQNTRDGNLRRLVKERTISLSLMPIIEKLLEKVGEMDLGNLGVLVDLCPTTKELFVLLEEAENMTK